MIYDYFASHPDHAILAGLIGFFVLSYIWGKTGRPRRGRDRSARDLYERRLRGEGRHDG
ncbi:MAG: hypothetical protein WCY92_01210 [Novosphingobium sp.]|jgi:hypothetical protein